MINCSALQSAAHNSSTKFLFLKVICNARNVVHKLESEAKASGKSHNCSQTNHPEFPYVLHLLNIFMHPISWVATAHQSWINYFSNVFQLQNPDYFSK